MRSPPSVAKSSRLPSRLMPCSWHSCCQNCEPTVSHVSAGSCESYRLRGGNDTAIAALACLERDDFSAQLPTSAWNQFISFSDTTNLGMAALGHGKGKVMVCGQARLWKTRPTALLLQLKHPPHIHSGTTFVQSDDEIKYLDYPLKVHRKPRNN